MPWLLSGSHLGPCESPRPSWLQGATFQEGDLFNTRGSMAIGWFMDGYGL